MQAAQMPAYEYLKQSDLCRQSSNASDQHIHDAVHANSGKVFVCTCEGKVHLLTACSRIVDTTSL